MPKERTIDIEALDEILDECDPQPQPQQSNGKANGHQHRGSFDVTSLLAAHGVQIVSTDQHDGGTRYTLAECVLCKQSSGRPAVFVAGDGKVGFKCFETCCTGKGWKDFREKLEPGYRDRKSSTASSGPTMDSGQAVTFERITARELDANTYLLEYLIDGLLVKAQPQLLAGSKKCLKTNILCDAVISLATGLDFLGKFRVGRPVRTAFMSGESGLHTIQETCRRICRAKGIELSDVDGLIFSPDLPRVDDKAHLTALEQFIGEVEVLVADPAFLMMPGGDAGNLFIQGEMLRNLARLCEAKGVTLKLCHHTRKGGIADPFEPPELEHIAWAGFQEHTRGWWLVGRREKYEPGTGHHRLWLSVGGSAGHSSLWGLNINEGVYKPGERRVWEVEVLTAQDARESAKRKATSGKQAKAQEQLNQDVRALLEVAGKYPEGETKNILKTAAGISGSRANLAIASALKSGRLVECEVFKSSRRTPYEGLKPVNKPDQSDQSD